MKIETCLLFKKIWIQNTIFHIFIYYKRNQPRIPKIQLKTKLEPASQKNQTTTLIESYFDNKNKKQTLKEKYKNSKGQYLWLVVVEQLLLTPFVRDSSLVKMKQIWVEEASLSLPHSLSLSLSANDNEMREESEIVFLFWSRRTRRFSLQRSIFLNRIWTVGYYTHLTIDIGE